MTEKKKTVSKDDIISKIEHLTEKVKSFEVRLSAIENGKDEPTKITMALSARLDALERSLEATKSRDINPAIEQRVAELEFQQRGLWDKLKKGISKCKQGIQTAIDKAKENPLIKQGYALAKANIPQLQQVENLAHKAGIRDLEDDFPDYVPPQNRDIDIRDIQQRVAEMEYQQRGLWDKLKKVANKCKQGVQTAINKAKENPLVQQAYAVAKANVPGLQNVENLANKVGIRELDLEERALNPYLKPRIKNGVSWYKRRDIDMNSFVPDEDDFMNTPDPERAKKEAEMNAIKRNLEVLNRALGLDGSKERVIDLDLLVAETQKVKEDCIALNQSLKGKVEERDLKDVWNKVKAECSNALSEVKDFCGEAKDKAMEVYYKVKNEVLHRDLNMDEGVIIEKVKYELIPVIDKKINEALNPVPQSISRDLGGYPLGPRHDAIGTIPTPSYEPPRPNRPPPQRPPRTDPFSQYP